MASLKLSNLFRRGSVRPSLKDRAAGLRASLGTLRNPATLQLAPGSAEAKAAWRAACHQHSIRALPLHNCPELDHPAGGVWTTRELMRAMEAGEITVTEFARLQSIASERELRFAEITHELRIGELFALAHADEYPVASDEDAPASRGPDPIFAAIEAHRTAWAACDGLDDGQDPEGYEAAHDACTEALEAVEHTQPTTTAGLLALARYLDELLNREAGGQNVVSPSPEGHALAALINACLGLADAGAASDAPTKPDPVFAAIAASQSAEAAMTAFAASVAGRRMTDAERAQEDAIEREQRDTRAAVWTIVPTTDEGRAALARYVVLQAGLTFGPDWRAKLAEEFCGDLLLALLAAFAPAAIETASEGERA
ncbi:hypothetical protein ACQKQD_31985 [Methylobacterium sp. NPDC080182]|uniref:hypothetical protein n=1 Tax=Methylobacterium sp. NPDC080182 TaxID=3390590 RepID=UPI003D07833F